MIKRCLDEGTLQAYLDGELSQTRRAEAEAHIDACVSCASALQEAEGELGMFAQAFAGEDALSVPSERLRERIETVIAGLPNLPDLRGVEHSTMIDEGARSWSLRAWLAALVAPLNLTPARVTAFASVAAVVAFALVFGVIKSRPANESREELASNRPATTVDNASKRNSPAVVAQSNEAQSPLAKDANPPAPLENDGGEFVKARFNRSHVGQRRATLPVVKRGVETKERILPGEDRYLESIARLDKTIKAGGDLVLRPTVRAEYERNVAVVDQAISASRRNALRNPKDREAAKFLFSAYQSKVELMSAVADQAQFAILGR